MQSRVKTDEEHKQIQDFKKEQQKVKLENDGDEEDYDMDNGWTWVALMIQCFGKIQW